MQGNVVPFFLSAKVLGDFFSITLQECRSDTPYLRQKYWMIAYFVSRIAVRVQTFLQPPFRQTQVAVLSEPFIAFQLSMCLHFLSRFANVHAHACRDQEKTLEMV